MDITQENYYDNELSLEYWSNSLYHSFVGTPVFKGCEAKTMAKLRGEWESKPSIPMLQGSYVDEYFSGDLEKFKADNPGILTQKGELRAEFKKAQEIIDFIQQDDFFMRYIKGTGEQQVIITGEIGGQKWKGKLDNLYPKKAIVDLKVVKSIRELYWNPEVKEKITFIESYDYISQGAVYQELYRQMTGDKLPFFIAAISKEDVPDHEVIHIPDVLMEHALMDITSKMEYLSKIRSGELPPVPCGSCDYCRMNKRLESTISLMDLYT